MSTGFGGGVIVNQRKESGGGLTNADNLLTNTGGVAELGGGQNKETRLGMAAGVGPFAIDGTAGEILYFSDDNLGNVYWFFGQGDLGGTMINGLQFDTNSIMFGRCASREWISVQPGGLTNESLIVLGNPDGLATYLQIEGSDGWIALHGNMVGSRMAYFGPNNPGTDDTVKIQLGDVAGVANDTSIELLDAFKSIALKTGGNEAGFFTTDGASNPRVQLGDTLGLGNGMQIKVIDISRRIQIGDVDNINNSTTLEIKDNTSEFVFNGLQSAISGEVAVFDGINKNSLKSSQLEISAGTYNPTATAIFGFNTLTPLTAQYLKIGNVVTVSGQINATIFAGGDCRAEISLPIATSFLGGDCAGTCGMNGGTAFSGNGIGYISPKLTGLSDKAIIDTTLGQFDGSIFYHFTYRITPL